MIRISQIKLKKTYGPHVFLVLGNRITGVEKGWYEADSLPTVEEYQELRKQKFSTLIMDAVENAKSELESLRDELQDWYDNLPEGFQNGDKGDQLQEAISQLETAIDNVPDVPDCVVEVRVIIAPLTGREISRADRGSQAAYELRAAAEALEDLKAALPQGTKLTEDQEQEVEEFRNGIESAADDADAVEYPGMY